MNPSVLAGRGMSSVPLEERGGALEGLLPAISWAWREHLFWGQEEGAGLVFENKFFYRV